MSVFKGHEDLSLNRYYYSFYSFSQSEPNTIKSFVYDQNQTLIFAKDISFNSRNVPAMLTFLENSQVNPYALGKSNDEYLNMDIAFAGLYKKALSQRQQRTLMTFVNKTYKNVYYGTVEKYIVTIGDNGGTPVVYFNGDTSDPNPLAIIHSNGLYIFDQSDPSNANYTLEFRAIDTQNPYTTNVIIEGTPGTPNSYSVITVDNTTPTNLEYYINSTEPDVGTMKGDLFMGVYVVKTVENWASQTVFSIKAPFQDVYYDQPDLSFNSGNIAYFYVGDTTMTDFSLVFGPTVDSFDSTFYSSYVNKSGNVLTLDLTNYSGTAVYYFEDTSAGMGYVEAPVSGVYKIVELQSNGTFTLTSGFADLSYCAIGGGGAGGYGAINFSNESRGGNGGNGGQVIYGDYTFKNSINYTITIGAGGIGEYTLSDGTSKTNTNGSPTSITYSSSGSQIVIVDASGGNRGGYGWKNSVGNYISPIPIDISYSSTGAQAVNNTSDTPSRGEYGTGPFNYGAGGGAGASANSGSSKNSQGGDYGGGEGGDLTTRPGKDALANTGSGGGGAAGNGASPRYYGGNGGSGVVVINVETNSYSFDGLYNEIIDGEFIVNPYTVSVSGEEFYIDSGGGAKRRPYIIFNDGETYVFDQSDDSNTDYPIVFGVTKDSTPYYTSGVTVVGSPGQLGAYTRLDYNGSTPLFYFSSGAINMGSFEPYTVKVVQNWAGNNVFSIQAPGDDLFYNQPDLSFNAGDSAVFYVGDSSITGPGYNLVFGTEIDNADTILGSPYVSQSGTLIGLNLPSDYTGGTVYYFENTNTGMGYVEVVAVVEHKIVELQSNGTFTLTFGSADLSYCAIGGGGSGGQGFVNGGSESRGGNGGNGGQVIYGDYTFENSINYTITIGAGGTGHTSANTNTNGGATSISSGGSQIVNAPGGLKGGNGGGNTIASVTVVANSSTGARAVNGTGTNDIPLQGQDGTGPFNYGAGGGAGASAGTVDQNKNSQGGNYGGGDGGYLTATDTSTRPGKDAVANTGSGGGGGSGNGAASPRYYGGKGGSGVVVIYAKTKSYSFTGSYNERTENVDVIVNPYTVTVSNDVFFIDTGSGAQSKPQITFTDGESYVFDQSNESNDGYPIVFGTTADDMSTLYTDGVTVVGTPGQPGAYTRLDYAGSTTLVYFSSEATNMGYNPYVATNYDIKSGMTFASASVTVTGSVDNRTWTQSGGNPSFTDGTYTVSYPSSGFDGSNCELLFTSNSDLAYYAQAYYNNGTAYETAVSEKSFAVTTANTQNYYGSYVQITLPYKLVLKQIDIVGQISGSLDLRPRTPYKVHLFGSNNNGTDFTYLGEEYFPYPLTNANDTSITITTITEGYYTIRMVINKTQDANPNESHTDGYGNAATALSQWHLTGHVLEI